MVEFALTFSIFVMLFICAFDLARAVYAQNILASATREGARYATTDPENTTGIRDFALARAAGLKTSDITVASACQPDCQAGNDITVTANYQFRPVTPFLRVLNLKSASTMTIE